MSDRKTEIEVANKRAAGLLSRTPIAKKVHYDRHSGSVIIDLSNGAFVGFKPRNTQGFEHAEPSQLERAEISPSGLGIYFPLIDADIYLPGFLHGLLGSRKWMAAQLGRIGGSVKSPAKILSARANGKLGGRPKKLRTAPSHA